MVQRRSYYEGLTRRAKDNLMAYSQIDEAALQKIERALSADPTWRGAQPLGTLLNEQITPVNDKENAVLIAVDGSQVYLEPRDIMMYYVINTGSIILQQGSSLSPITVTRPLIYYKEEDIYNSYMQLKDRKEINAERELVEMKELARLATEEKDKTINNISQLTIAITDGPLLIWSGEKDTDAQERQRISEYVRQLELIQKVDCIPLGCIDQPRSANVLRLLDILELPESEINLDRLRRTSYQDMTDRTLFANILNPNERSAIFINTARLNRRLANYDQGRTDGIFAEKGQQVCFFYLNVSRIKDEENAIIIRIDLPIWVTYIPLMIDKIHNSIYEDCEGMGYPYVLARAHELAVITNKDRRDFEDMLAIEMWKKGIIPRVSRKSFWKQQLTV